MMPTTDKFHKRSKTSLSKYK